MKHRIVQNSFLILLGLFFQTAAMARSFIVIQEKETEETTGVSPSLSYIHAPEDVESLIPSLSQMDRVDKNKTVIQFLQHMLLDFYRIVQSIQVPTEPRTAFLKVLTKHGLNDPLRVWRTPEEFIQIAPPQTLAQVFKKLDQDRDLKDWLRRSLTRQYGEEWTTSQDVLTILHLIEGAATSKVAKVFEKGGFRKPFPSVDACISEIAQNL